MTMENQSTEKVEVVEPVAAAPAATAKKTRLSNRTKNRMIFGVTVLAIALFAYNGGYLQKAGSKVSEGIAAVTHSLGFGSAAKAEDKLAAARSAFAAGDINGSIAGYRAIIAANPKNISAHGELGNVLYTVGAIPEARRLTSRLPAWRSSRIRSKSPKRWFRLSSKATRCWLTR